MLKMIPTGLGFAVAERARLFWEWEEGRKEERTEERKYDYNLTEKQSLDCLKILLRFAKALGYRINGLELNPRCRHKVILELCAFILKRLDALGFNTLADVKEIRKHFIDEPKRIEKLFGRYEP